MPNYNPIIYVPGLGDHKPQRLLRILKGWQAAGADVQFFPVIWNDSEPFESKFERLTKFVDEQAAKTGQVSLVGVSAGAGLALNAYMARPDKVSGVVYICGKLIGYVNVNPSYFSKNPAFAGSLKLTQTNLVKLTPDDKAKMLIIKPLFDEVVFVKNMLVPGIKTRTILSVLHVSSIFLALTVYKRITLNFLKDRQRP